MEALYSIGLFMGAMSVGMLPVVLVTLVMRVASVPGTLLWHMGKRAGESLTLGGIGFFLATILPAFVAGAYIVFVLGLLRYTTETYPELPTWPLWLAVWFHALLPTFVLASTDESGLDVPRSPPFGLLAIATLAIFLTGIFAPRGLHPVYQWVPLSTYAMEFGVSASDGGSSDGREMLSTLTPAHVKSVQSFFFAHQLAQSAQHSASQFGDVSKGLKEYARNVRVPLQTALSHLDECEPEVLNEIYPAWGEITQNALEPGVRKILAGMPPDIDRKTLAEGDRLLSEFSDWLEVNWEPLGYRLEQLDLADLSTRD